MSGGNWGLYSQSNAAMSRNWTRLEAEAWLADITFPLELENTTRDGRGVHRGPGQPASDPGTT
jgi:hypothetical protein